MSNLLIFLCDGVGLCWLEKAACNDFRYCAIIYHLTTTSNKVRRCLF